MLEPSGQTANAPPDEGHSQPFRRPTLGALPAAAAGTVGLFYVIGALAKLTELRGAGIDPRNAIGFVPIQQLLGRGIGTTFGVLLLVAWIPILFISLQQVRRKAAKLSESKRARVRSRATPAAFIATAMVFLIAPFPWVAIVSALLFLPVFLIHARTFDPLLALASTFAAVVILAIVGNYFYPARLPRVTLHLVGSPTPVTGGLIAIGDGNWYLARPDHTVLALRQDTVRSADIRRRAPHFLPRSLLQRLGVPLPKASN